MIARDKNKIMRIAIIGTAGPRNGGKRSTSEGKMSAQTFTWMVKQVNNYIDRKCTVPRSEIDLVSGGAAWSGKP